MRTDPAFRGRGFGRTMLGHLLDDAAARGIGRLSLETGKDPFFAPALAMYTAAGFREARRSARTCPTRTARSSRCCSPRPPQPRLRRTR